MSVFPRERIRIRIDTDAKAGNTGVTDDITGSSPDAWKGTNVQFEIGLFFGGELIDISNIETLTFLAKDANNLTGPKILEKSISSSDMDATLTQDAWEAQTGQHAVLEFSDADMNIALNGQQYRDLWLMIHGVSADGDKLAFGAARLRIWETGIDSTANPVPPIGSNLVPGGAVYDGAGHYILNVTSGLSYDWSKGANDSQLVNGTETLSASGRFTAQGATIQLNGSAALAVTSVVRQGVLVTLDEMNARLDALMKVIGKPGQVFWVQSENGRYLRGISCTDDGDLAYPKIDRQA